MFVILLCAGFGTRLRPLTDSQPKALVEVAGRPLVDYLLDQLVTWNEIVAVHVVHNDRHPAAWAQWREAWKGRLERLNVVLHNNGVRDAARRRGAVGDLRFVLCRTGIETPAAVAAGDSLYRISLRPVIDRFIASSANCVLALPQPDEVRRRHSSVFDLDGPRVRGVVHEPAEPPSSWVSPAFYALRPAGLAHVEPYLARGGDEDTLGRFIHDLAQHQRVEIVKHHGPSDATRSEETLRYHINTPDEQARAHETLADEPVFVADEAI